MIAQADLHGRILVEMRAQWWDPDPPTRVTYCATATELMLPLLRIYNRTYRARHRFRIQKAALKGPQLSPRTKTLFERFAIAEGCRRAAGHRRQPARSAVHGRCAEPEVGCRLHLHLDREGLALRRDRHPPVLQAGSRLVNERHHDCPVRDRRADDGDLVSRVASPRVRETGSSSDLPSPREHVVPLACG